jgi:hypothetical protein
MLPQCIPQAVEPVYQIPNHSNQISSEEPNPRSAIAGDESPEGSDKEERKAKFNGSRRRNVYKSIVRHMQTYTRKNSLSLMKMLKDKGFSKEEIEHAFFIIGSREEEKKHKFKFLMLLNKMVKNKSIYTYIIKETLSATMDDWEKGKKGRILEKNYEMYKRVCETYYRDALQTLSNN